MKSPLFVIQSVLTSVAAFMPPKSSSNTSTTSSRGVAYAENMAQYLLDLHDAAATFDFCGGMMFQLELTDALREYLKSTKAPLAVSDKLRMHQLDGYERSGAADNVQYFHGRELRNVGTAAGGMGMVLQLSLAPPPPPPSSPQQKQQQQQQQRIDPQGWSVEEMQTYDGWGSDRGRVWRQAADYQAEGFDGFAEKFGPKAFGLNHRFYLHTDRQGKLWLAAEDGCEGTPATVMKSSTAARKSSPGLASLASGKHSVTPFQKKVLQALCLVPEGKVTTYKYLAQKVNCASHQAVGQALRRNPYAPVVACHRVVAHSRQLGGFGGARDGVKLEKKRKLLEEEGVLFDEQGNVAMASIFDFKSLSSTREKEES